MDLDSEIQSSNKFDIANPRQLVLDYLLHNCYGETARAFMKDDLDAVKDSSDFTANGRKNGSGASATNGASSAAAMPQGGAMTRNASSESNNNINNIDNDDIHHRRARHPASLMMGTEKEELDQEGDSPMGESYLDTTDSLSTSTFTADKAHALHIDEQLKNLETRKAIRSLISMGDIGPAMDMCNAAFPGVLSIDPHSPLTTPSSIHMNFKLQCQKFIEIVRLGPERGSDALMFAQQVLSDFTRLDPLGKDKYIKHMEEIGTVIAFNNPEDSPNSHHLKQEARDHLADIMNSAVLGTGKMAIIIVPGGVELNEQRGNGKGYSDRDKDELTSQSTSNTNNNSGNHNHLYIIANNTTNLDSA
ncbi:Ran-binding protein 9 [Mortierella hygrophila]|uniref:Ran-binding protein 9 n=1 Tax=Mortierella hygrophila TaxID=979708 RepID=A0A9P6K0H5_9FUNG|nr:Ran-binding protein 9 [Mortierella hygrophila]